MVDQLTAEHRSWLMSRVRGKNTTPEIRTRRCAYAMGLRFRLNRKDLPGTPDLVFPKHRLVVFVHGCFWHRHPDCSKASSPKSRPEYWQAKFGHNITRDSRVAQKLETMGWRVEIVWECETRDPDVLRKRLESFLDSDRLTDDIETSRSVGDQAL